MRASFMTQAMAQVPAQRSHTSAMSAMNIIGALIVIGLIALYANQIRRRRRNGMLPFVRPSREVELEASREQFNENDFLAPPRSKDTFEERSDDTDSTA